MLIQNALRCALGIVRGRIIFIWDSEKSADFSESLFTERGRDREWQLSFLHFGKPVIIVVDVVFRYGPSREKANRENPQIFPIGKYK